MKNSLFAGKLSFAHLTGRLAASAVAPLAEKQTEQTQEDGDAEAKAAEAKAAAEKEAAEKEASAKAEKQTQQGEDGANDTDSGASKAKTPKADDDDSDGDEEMRGKSAEASARLRERARCAAILGNPAAARNAALACSLAFNSTMTRQEAIHMLEQLPEVQAEVAPNRAARNPALGAGGETALTGKQAVAAGWDRSMSRNAASKRRENAR